MIPRRVLLLVIAALAVAAQPGTVIRTETSVVLVDAIVTGKNGAYVRDLNAGDFHVWQDNKEQHILSFAVESASQAPQPHSLVLFFDSTSMDPRDQIVARQAASAFIDGEVGPNRKMAVVEYRGAIRVAQNFTDNAGRLKDALPISDANVTQEEKSVRAPVGAPVNSAAADLGARNLIRSLGSLGRSLDVLPGRKIIVLFSGKLSPSSNQRYDLKDAIETCNQSGVAVYPVDARPVSVQTDMDTRPNALPVDRRAPAGSRSRGPQGDADDTIGSIPDGGAAGQQLLFALAQGTGGFVIRNSNDLLGGLQSVAEEQNQSYVLTYSPPESKEGSCHNIRVKVDRPGTNVRARTSYCTSKPLDLLAGTVAGKDLEKRTGAAQPGDLSASLQLPYFYQTSGVARVHVVMEIAPDKLEFRSQKGKFHVELNFLGIATTPEGAVRARFSDALKLDFDDRTQAAARPVHYEKEFKLAPGRYNFTMTFSQGEESFGKQQVPLVVDPWVKDAALSGVAFSRETRPAGDLGLGGLADDHTPLVVEGVQLIPTASAIFDKSAATFFYFELHSPDSASARVRLRVLDRKNSEARWDSGPMKLPVPATIGPGPVPAATRLPLDALNPGAYQIEITASMADGTELRRSADFEVR
jgi:VWFA-related protein